MNQLVETLKIETKDVLVDNGEQGFWNQSWYETRYGLMDSHGFWVVPAIFKDISQSEDMFIANYESKGGKKVFFITNTGKVIKNNNLNIIEAKDFKHSCSIIHTADIFSGGHNVPWTYVSNLCKWGLIDKKGNVVVPPIFDYDYEVKIKNMSVILNEVKQFGCEILNYADESLFTNVRNVVMFRKAIKLYLLTTYSKTRDKQQLKIDVTNQNKEFKKIKTRKLAENLFSIRINNKNNVHTSYDEESF